MKKISFFLLLLLLSCSFSYAKTVAVNDAKTVGYNYLVQKGTTGLNSINDLQLVYTSGSSPAYFYVFGGNNCFVIVSADDAVVPVLGYSTNHIFGTSHMPSNVSNFLDNYNKQINYVIANKAAATAAITTSWSNLRANTPGPVAKTTTVSPLLSTTWDQYNEFSNTLTYNADCPIDAGASYFGGRDVTGCVATAMAQVMKFWNWPSTGVGFNSYVTGSYGTLSSNFSTHTYSWGSMPNSVTSANAAVATLMSDAGISVNMDYTADESGAYVISSESPITNCAEYAFKTYFNYQTSLHGEARTSYSDATWTSMLQAELDAGRPVIYTGDGSAGGHCFVFDGYDNSGNFDVNWGWSGNSDGYYTIDALNPPALGAGGGSGGFNSDQTAIFGLQPNSGSVVATGMALASSVNLSASSIYYYQPITVTTKVINGGSTAFSGSYAAFVFNSSGVLIDSIQVLSGSLAAGATSNTLTFTTGTNGLYSMLPGTYTISIYYRPTGSNWTLLGNGSYTNSASISVTNSNYMELYDNMTPSPIPFVQGSAGQVSLNIANLSTGDFNGDYDVSLYNLDGTFACNVQTMYGIYLPAGDDYLNDITFSTSNITAPPGTYFLALEANDTVLGTNWFLAGADYFENPIYVTVVAPPLSPDIYEVNNTAATAYNLSSTLNWVSNNTSTGTPGSNFHISTDQDYYKLVFPAGYNYALSARVDDDASSDNSTTYTTDAIWSYSTDNGNTWSAVYDDVMPGTINLTGYTGGTVIFHVSPHNAGGTGTYLLKMGSITRTPPEGISQVELSAAKIYPNPATETVTIDLSGTGAHATQAMILDMQGRIAYKAEVNSKSIITIPVTSLAAGLYFIEVKTDAGVLNKKITVSR